MKSQLFLIFILWGTTTFLMGQGPKNDPILEKPILDRKMVVAHTMTTSIPETHPRFFQLENAGPDGETGHLGGVTTMPMIAFYAKGLSFEAELEYEMRAAKKIGIDCLAFYYPCPADEKDAANYNRVIAACFKILDANPDLDFKLTLCPSHPCQKIKDRSARLPYFVKNVKELLETTRNSKAWLKTPDGRFLFTSYAPNLMGKNASVEATSEVFAEAARQLGISLALIYHPLHRHLFFQQSKKNTPEEKEEAYRAYLQTILDYFPGITGFNENPLYEPHRIGMEDVIQACTERKRTYAPPLMPSFFFHKLTHKGKLLHNGGEVFKDKSLKPSDFIHYDTSFNLSETFRSQLDIGLTCGTMLWNVNTWNDYQEGHALAPEINHNFGFSVLLQYYKQKWIDPNQPLDKDRVVVFFKKYPRKAKPSLFDIPVATPGWVATKEYNEEYWAKEDAIEVITILKDDGELTVNGDSLGHIESDLTVTRVPMKPGPVKVSVQRKGDVAVDLITPEWITEKPFRTDRDTYSFSSECRRMYFEIFKQFNPKEMHTASEYAEDDSGTPNWKKIWLKPQSKQE